LAPDATRLKWVAEPPQAGMRPRPKASKEYEVRLLKQEDLSRGFIETLDNLSDTADLTPRKAAATFREIRRDSSRAVFVAVREDGEIVGTTTLLIERKFIHGGGLVGHIEDVAVRRGNEGQGIGGALVTAAADHARLKRCYKCILDCKEEVVPFYTRLGFRRHDVGMRLDLG